MLMVCQNATSIRLRRASTPLVRSHGDRRRSVLRGFHVVDASERANELIARNITGSDIRSAIPSWPEETDPSVPFDAVLRVDDEDLPIEVRTRTLPDLVVASIRDARALIAGRQARRISSRQKKYRSLVEQIPAVVYSDDGEVTNYVSPQIEQILGVSPAAYLADPDTWMRMVHPDDRATSRAAERRVPRRPKAAISTDYRMVRPDGRIVWIRDRAFAQRDDEGRGDLGAGILFDITELKDAEARIAHMAFHDGLTETGQPAALGRRSSWRWSVGRRDRIRGRGSSSWISTTSSGSTTRIGHHAGDLLLIGGRSSGYERCHPWHRPGRSSGRRRVPDPARGSGDVPVASMTLTALAGRGFQLKPSRTDSPVRRRISPPSASIGISQFPRRWVRRRDAAEERRHRDVPREA